MKKNLLTSIAFFLILQTSFSQNKTCRQICDGAIATGKPSDALEYIKKELPSVQAPQEKRALLAYKGSLEEMQSLYSEAKNSYAQAAGIAAGDAEGMPKKSSEALVIDAVRCALCAGESETALSFLNSAVRNSKSPKIQAEIKLYEQWARLSIAENYSDAQESEALLKTYLSLPSMESVKVRILLTLWYLTGEKEYANELEKNFPQTAEAAIATGKAQILPAPFWFFLPRKKVDGQEGNVSDSGASASSEVKTAAASTAEKSSSEEKVPASQVTASFSDGKTSTAVTASSSEGKALSEESASTGAATSTPSSKENPVSAPSEKASSKGKALSSSKETSSSDSSKEEKTVSSSQKASSEKTHLQLGLFRDKNNAENFALRIKEKGFSPYIMEDQRASGTIYYLVIVDDNAEGTMALHLKSAGFESYPIY